ncbi:MAG: hypothetical protein ACFB16_26650 [Phormidesmis sp.]
MKLVLQIVPKLPPQINGLGDYSFMLAKQLRHEFEIETKFIVCDDSSSYRDELDGFPVMTVKSRSADAIATALSSCLGATVLLHYVGYGYAKRGCPRWLVSGLASWRQQQADSSRLITMFHEVYASSKIPWTSSFWLSSVQKQLAAQLVHLSNRIFTSNQTMTQLIANLTPEVSSVVKTLPVFSTVGESVAPPGLEKRSRRLLIFGHRNSRTQVYEQCRTTIEYLCQMLSIEEICDVGKPTGLTLSEFNNVPVVEKGILEASEISWLMADSVVGLLNFPPPRFLAKSTVFAAYCAHGVIPCMARYEVDPIDGLRVNQHYWTVDSSEQLLTLGVGQVIADNAYRWYSAHSLSAQAKSFADNLGLLSQAP